MKPSPLFLFLHHLSALLPAMTLTLFLLLSEPLAILLLSMSAILFHELGHLFFFALCGLPLPRLGARGAGLRLLPREPLLPCHELLVCLGGPLFNILGAWFLFRLGSSFGVMGGGLHLLYGLFNLLPLASTDGERLLRLFLTFFFPARGKSVCQALACVLLILLFFFSLFLYYLTGYGLSVLFFSLFCYFSPKEDRKTFFEI